MSKIKDFIVSLFIALTYTFFSGFAIFFVIWLICALFHLPSSALRILVCVACGILFLYFFYRNSLEGPEFKRQKDEIARLEKENIEVRRARSEAEEIVTKARQASENANEHELQLRDYESHLDAVVDSRVSARLNHIFSQISNRYYFRDTAVFSRIPDEILSKRLASAYSETPYIFPPLRVSADIEGHDGTKYHTTLNNCTCPDFRARKNPCKHMYCLAIELGLSLFLSDENVNESVHNVNATAQAVQEKLTYIESREDKILKREAALNKRIQEVKQALDIREKDISSRENEIIRLRDEAQQQYPWLAKAFADYYYLEDIKTSDYLRQKKHPAISAAEQVTAIAREKRELQMQCKLYEYQLNYFISVFPWLDEFRTLEPKEGARYVSNADAGYDEVRRWLSPAEYNELSVSERNQLALNRYLNRKRSDWEAGIDYERYVGYIYEQQGYKVQFFGATNGLQDMGRDLIAESDELIYVIQCKRWSKEKTIHEKHIFQLYGSTVLLSLESSKPVVGVFITTTVLSETAKKCAEHLNIEIRENFQLDDYPLIKCNIPKDGSKIYHLPFDQQYDRVRIIQSAGEFYAHSISEAENAGFRRAKRWLSDTQ